VTLAQGLGTGEFLFLALAVGMALAFEFVNGFHDTANAVATVIYTNTLRPWVAVIWSGCWNLIGVLTSRGGVAFTIVALLPVELVLNVGSSAGFAMVFALLISAILWNLGTWYLGLPASSTHALTGSILGVGLANAAMQKHGSIADGVNWGELEKVMISLVVSPVIGFVFSGLLLLVAKLLIRNPALFRAPPKGAPPPWGVRGLLVLTCTGVSFGHGLNDGQKGMGLLLLILVGILPGTYALRPETSAAELLRLGATARAAQVAIERHVPAGVVVAPEAGAADLSDYLRTRGKVTGATWAALGRANRSIVEGVSGVSRLGDVPEEQRKALRANMYLVGATLAKLDGQKQIADPAERAVLIDGAGEGATGYRAQLDAVTKFIPVWVKVAVALALGLGTMIGWKRIVVTVGEKIGKEHLTYAQGASAELVAAATIIGADYLKLPVSTTHVLSSGVAGTMAANHSGLQVSTLRNLLLAWVLTLPVCMMLGAATFAAGLVIVLNQVVPFVVAAAGLGGAVAGVTYARRRMRVVRAVETSV
jgi:PiT family inorganic phosphate transporter